MTAARPTNEALTTWVDQIAKYTTPAAVHFSWWEGKDALGADEVLEDWPGQPWTQRSATPAAHPNSRFTAALANLDLL